MDDCPRGKNGFMDDCPREVLSYEVALTTESPQAKLPTKTIEALSDEMRMQSQRLDLLDKDQKRVCDDLAERLKTLESEVAQGRGDKMNPEACELRLRSLEESVAKLFPERQSSFAVTEKQVRADVLDAYKDQQDSSIMQIDDFPTWYEMLHSVSKKAARFDRGMEEIHIANNKIDKLLLSYKPDTANNLDNSGLLQECRERLQALEEQMVEMKEVIGGEWGDSLNSVNGEMHCESVRQVNTEEVGGKGRLASSAFLNPAELQDLNQHDVADSAAEIGRIFAGYQNLFDDLSAVLNQRNIADLSAADKVSCGVELKQAEEFLARAIDSLASAQTFNQQVVARINVAENGVAACQVSHLTCRQCD
jgi:hypothetical protein